MSTFGLSNEYVEQEEALAWLAAESYDAENAMDWLAGIGGGAATGAAAGAAAGPWGALIGAGIGAGLGALQTAQQQEKPKPGGAAPATPSAPVTAVPTAPVTSGQPSAGAALVTTQQLLQQLALLVPLLTRFLAQQATAKKSAEGMAAGEDQEGELSGDYVPDEAFLFSEESLLPGQPLHPSLSPQDLQALTQAFSWNQNVADDYGDDGLLPDDDYLRQEDPLAWIGEAMGSNAYA